MNENKDTNKLDNSVKQENINFVSFSKKDKDGNFSETYGYFRKLDSNQTIEERIAEMTEKLKGARK